MFHASHSLKMMFVLLLSCSWLVHADDPGSQYESLAKQGDKHAQYFLADTYVSAGDLAHATYWAEKAASQGLPDAYALLAEIHLEGKKDFVKAKYFADKAASSGSRAGEVILSRLLINSRAGLTDCSRATALLTQVSAYPDDDAAVDAQMMLGIMNAAGVCLPENTQMAHYWLQRSSSISRTGYAEYWAGMAFLKGDEGIVKPDQAKAAYWFKQSCIQGFDSGCDNIELIK